jgi:N-acyl-D-aspartate/D-glutamate deacylase
MQTNTMHDLVIRNGKIFDGSGDKPFVGDIAIDNMAAGHHTEKRPVHLQMLFLLN